VSLIGCIVLQQYAFTQVQSTDLFETANFWNPVMQYYRFGEIPFLYNMSSHLISDYFFQFVYTTFNGFDTSTDLQLYDFLKWALYIYSIYLFAIHYFENKYAAIFFVLLSPFLWFIVSPLYSLVFVSIYFIIKYLKEFEKKFLIYFFGSIVLITFWNLTIGVSLVFAAFLFSACLFIYFKEQRIHLLKVIAVFGISSIACLGIYHLSFPTHLRQFLLYFSANQAHGYSQLTNSFSIEFALNYYVYPIIISLIFIANFLQLKTKANITKNFVLIFLSGIYFFSLQRGLVRHSFIENNESLIATTARLIILLEVYHRIKSTKYAFVALFSSVFVFSTFTTIQTNFEGSSNFVEAKVTFSLNDLPHLGKEKLQRTLPNHEYEWRTKTIVNFLKSNLSQQETFLDFTYNPTLYYYTQKNVPSFFSQHIQNTVSEKAQEMNIEELQKSSIKYVLFACQNGFGVNNKFQFSEITPNKVSRIAQRHGNQSYNITFKRDINTLPLRDNLNRPVTEMYLTTINRGYFGWFHEPIFDNIGTKEGFEFNLTNFISPYWGINNTQMKIKLLAALLMMVLLVHGQETEFIDFTYTHVLTEGGSSAELSKAGHILPDSKLIFKHALPEICDLKDKLDEGMDQSSLATRSIDVD
jgi:hypothetical protein